MASETRARNSFTRGGSPTPFPHTRVVVKVMLEFLSDTLRGATVEGMLDAKPTSLGKPGEAVMTRVI